VKLREFRGFDWPVSDMNIDPVSTLEAFGRVVGKPACGRGASSPRSSCRRGPERKLCPSG